MLKRDFTKSNKEYFIKNKKILISIGVFLLIGILLLAIIGLNGNFEVAGYNEFTVTVTEEKANYFMSSGLRAVRDLVMGKVILEPEITKSEDYYNASLSMLAYLAYLDNH